MINRGRGSDILSFDELKECANVPIYSCFDTGGVLFSVLQY